MHKNILARGSNHAQQEGSTIAPFTVGVNTPKLLPVKYTTSIERLFNFTPRQKSHFEWVINSIKRMRCGELAWAQWEQDGQTIYHFRTRDDRLYESTFIMVPGQEGKDDAERFLSWVQNRPWEPKMWCDERNGDVLEEPDGERFPTREELIEMGFGHMLGNEEPEMTAEVVIEAPKEEKRRRKSKK